MPQRRRLRRYRAASECSAEERSSTVKLDETLLLRVFIVETVLIGVVAALVPLLA